MNLCSVQLYFTGKRGEEKLGIDMNIELLTNQKSTKYASNFSKIPSVERLVSSKALACWEELLVRPVRVGLAREFVQQLRQRVTSGKNPPSFAQCETELGERFRLFMGGRMRRVLNGSGVILHTNLGRAPLGSQMLKNMVEQLSGYCSLEYALDSAKRGNRSETAQNWLKHLCGAQAALVVNNNAAALFLVLHVFAKKHEVLISRGELVQIGGGFRIPEILEVSGARLVEVGTTNITTVEDYKSHISKKSRILLKVYPSNFSIAGHTEIPSISELTGLASEFELISVLDLGSGLMTVSEGDELRVEQAIRSGFDIVCFSGDKLLGGPQAGIIVGNAQLLSKLRSSALYRALRLGKAELFLLEEVLSYYIAGKLPPVWDLIKAPIDEIKMRADLLAKKLIHLKVEVKVIESRSTIGGGSLPGFTRRSYALSFATTQPEILASKLRMSNPPIISRCERNTVLIDLSAIFCFEDEELLAGLREVFQCLY